MLAIVFGFAALSPPFQDANPLKKVFQILTNLESKIKAEGVDAHKARDEFTAWCNTQSSGLTASLVRHRHSGKCDRRHHREGDERWSFDDAVANGRQRHRCTRGGGTQTVTSSLLASDASVTRKCCSSQASSGFHVTSRRLHPQVFVRQCRVVKRHEHGPRGFKRQTKELTASAPSAMKINVGAPPHGVSSLSVPNASVARKWCSIKRFRCQASGGKRWVGGEPRKQRVHTVKSGYESHTPGGTKIVLQLTVSRSPVWSCARGCGWCVHWRVPAALPSRAAGLGARGRHTNGEVVGYLVLA